MSEISCNNCQAACCQGNTLIKLSRTELKFMEKGGNTFITVAKPKKRDRENVAYPQGYEIDEDGKQQLIYRKGHETYPLQRDYGRYLMLGECAYLAVDDSGWQHCSVYEDRPAACSEFEVGSYACRLLRVINGVDDESPEIADLIDYLSTDIIS